MGQTTTRRKPRPANGTKSLRKNGRANAANLKPGPVPEFRNYDEFMALSDADKERVWESLNREIPLEETRPLTPAERKLWDRAKRRGRPKQGQGAKAVSVTIEGGLLARADAYAKEKGLTRARLIAIALDSLLGEAERYKRRAGKAADPTPGTQRP